MTGPPGRDPAANEVLLNDIQRRPEVRPLVLPATRAEQVRPVDGGRSGGRVAQGQSLFGEGHPLLPVEGEVAKCPDEIGEVAHLVRDPLRLLDHPLNVVDQVPNAGREGVAPDDHAV